LADEDNAPQEASHSKGNESFRARRRRGRGALRRKGAATWIIKTYFKKPSRNPRVLEERIEVKVRRVFKREGYRERGKGAKR